MPVRLRGIVNDGIATTGSSSARSSTRSSSRGSRIDKTAVGESGARGLPGEGFMAKVIVEPSWLSPSGRGSISGTSIIPSSLPLSPNSGVIVLTLLRFIVGGIVVAL